MAAPKDETWQFQIHRQILAGAMPFRPVLAALLVVAGALALLGAGQYRRSLVLWEERQSSIADNRAHLVSSWLWERRGDTEASSLSAEVRTYLRGIAAGIGEEKPSPAPMIEHLMLFSAAKRLSGYRGIYVTDRDGRVTAQVPGSVMPSPMLGSAARPALDSRQFRIEWLPAGPNQGMLCFISPVPDGTDGTRAVAPLGTLILLVDPHENLFPMLTAETVPTRTGETVLVTRAGNELLYISPLRFGSAGYRATTEHSPRAALDALEGRQTFGTFLDYRGVEVLAATRRIPVTGWGLVTKIDSREALAGYRRELRVEAAAAVLLVLAFGGWIFGHRRGVWARLQKSHEEESRRLFESTPDGLIILDADRRMVYVNSRTERLFGFTREELRGREFHFLVPQADLAPSGGLEARERDAAGMETSGRRKDGTVFPIEIAISTVMESNGGLLCAAVRDLTPRKQIEAHLKRTEEEYAALFHSVSDAIFVLDQDAWGIPGKILQVNDVACERLGYTREELLNCSLSDIHKPGALAAMAGLIDSLAARQGGMFETEHVSREGRLIPVEVNAKMVAWRGQPAWLALARDITKRKQAETLLHASEQRYRRYVERNAAAFLRTELDGTLLECNDAMVRLLGYESAAELQSHNILDFYVQPADRQPIIDRLREEGALNSFEICLQAKGGVRVWALVNMTLVTEPDGTSYIEATSIDITERKRIENELRLTASVVEASTDFIGFGSLNGEVLFINQAGRRMIGLQADQPVRGTRILDHVMDEDREHFQDEVLGAAIRDGQWAGETRLKHVVTGEAIQMWQSVFCITDHQTGRRIAVATICRDLTRRKQEERDLKAAMKAAEAGNRAKSLFLANMSHEIRTPLNGILGMTRLLLAGDLSPEQRQYAAVALSSGEKLLSVVNQVLDLSKIEAGKVELEVLDFDLAELLEDITHVLLPEARRKGLEFRYRIDPAAACRAHGDSGRLRQVIINLASNAIKFTSAGQVEIEVEVASREGLPVMLHFLVKDSGVGIAPEQAAKLFSPFVQGDASTTRKFGGTGLGLAISKQLVELMGGSIGFESRPGQGSSFWFTIPVEKQAGECPAPPAARAVLAGAALRTGGRQSARILLAEDHSVNCMVILAVLDQLGYHADAVSNGKEAVEALQTARYDLVLMDCQMPVMDGYEATRLIRDPSTRVLNPGIPIVAVTASAFPEDREMCFQSGMDEYMSKPIDPDTLARVLDRWLAHRLDEVSTPTRAAVPPPGAVFEPDAFMSRLGGNRALAQKVMGAFLAAAPEQLSSLRNQLTGRDAQAARREAHTLKGAAATISAPLFRGLALEAERAATAGDWDRMEEILPRMEEQLERLRAAVANWG